MMAKTHEILTCLQVIGNRYKDNYLIYLLNGICIVIFLPHNREAG